MTTTIRTTDTGPASRRASAAAAVTAASAAAVVLNLLVAAAAVALGADGRFPPFEAGPIVAFTVGGAVAAAIGWTLVSRRARHPRRALTVLVPVLFVVTAVPDLLVAVGALPIPYSGPAEGAALLVMHLVVVGALVPTLARLLPPRA